ncbi:Tn3 family transposase [Streptomyces anulatus]|uniref:Tn3 family transposase n=1 Tax=Streptomyces anulatus TaxID=1892 RepID=UPI003667DA0D
MRGRHFLLDPAEATGAGSHKNSTCAVFREAGCVIRTVQLPRRRVTAATNRVDSFNRSPSGSASATRAPSDNDPIEQERATEFNSLLTNAVIFPTPEYRRDRPRTPGEGWEIALEGPADISSYLTAHIKRFGEYSTHEVGTQPGRTVRSRTSTSPSSATRSRPPPA